MKTRGVHPDFEKAAPGRRWTGSLAALRRQLEHEAIVNAASPDAPGSKGFAWRILRGGASVGMRLIRGRLELRVARSERPSVGQLGAWERELAVFVDQMGAKGWTRGDAESPGVAAIFSTAGERRDRACGSCGKQLDDAALLYGGEVCTGCGVRSSAEGTVEHV